MNILSLILAESLLAGLAQGRVPVLGGGGAEGPDGHRKAHGQGGPQAEKRWVALFSLSKS